MRAILLALLLVAPLLLAGCATNSEGNVDVMTTFYPLGFLAQRIAGGEVSVGTLVPAGMEPHDWEPSPADVARMGEAKLFLAQGSGFEPWLPGLQGALGNQAPPVIYLTAGLPLREGEDDHADAHTEDEHADEAHAEEGHADEASNETHADEAGNESHADEPHADEAAAEEEAHIIDPHTWLDPVLFARQAKLAEDALAAAFPAQAATFRANGEALRADLDALHAEFAAGLDSCETRTIIANHNAYGYLGERYDFTVVAISGLTPEAEPSPQDMRRAVDAAREHNATIIFFEELVSDQVARAVANEVGAETRVLSPLEGLTDEQRAAGADYLSVMRANLGSLREAMRCA